MGSLLCKSHTLVMLDRVQPRACFYVGMTNHLVMVFHDREELLEKQQVKKSRDVTAFCDIGESVI